MRKVGVFFGGRSCENEISVLTGVFVARLLQENFEILPVYLHTDGRAYTSPKMIELDVFKNVKVERFERILFEEGTAYAFSPTKKKLRKIVKLDGAKPILAEFLHAGDAVLFLIDLPDLYAR